ncbi:MAG: L-rhamnose mutarotase [Gemmatimonadaceae bacterium]|nr:L-rhamnose mutarotase [Gemmatimonadaceae bacterium]
MIRLRPEHEAEYRRLHAAVWPDVLATIRDCRIRNYTIYLKDGWLFSHYEYHGDDHAADQARMAADPVTQRWWQLTAPCQEPLPTRGEGEWWASMEELFHAD